MNQNLALDEKYAGPIPERNQPVRSARWTKISGSGSPALTPILVTGFGNLPTISNIKRLNSTSTTMALISTQPRMNEPPDDTSRTLRSVPLTRRLEILTRIIS